MHPFGGIHLCPKCSKAVYAAEQVMGPGRKLYHKPCLSCTSCNKRLDSYTLLEHDERPFCKPCHVKNFATRDLRHANLPNRDPLFIPTDSPHPLLPARVPSPVRTLSASVGSPKLPRLRPTRSLAATVTPHSPTFPLPEQLPEEKIQSEEVHGDADEERDTVPADLLNQPSAPVLSTSPVSSTRPSFPMTTGMLNNYIRPGLESLPRFGALSPSHNKDIGSSPSRPYHQSSKSVPIIEHSFKNGDSEGQATGSLDNEVFRPLFQTSTGTRYGAALTGNLPSQFTGNTSPKRWGGSNPTCPRCGKSVYFAEQVRAVGKTYHKSCLRCMECNSLLDSSRLRDHNNEPICVRCYGKLHGPQGNGYALLGKAGG